MSVTLESTRGLRIAGSGVALPSDLGAPSVVAGRITNEGLYRALFGPAFAEELARRGWNVDDPEARYGIRTREWIHRAGEEVRDGSPDAGDLAICAAQNALADARATGESVDVLLAATSTPARITSTLAARVGAALRVRGACLDVRAGGAGGLAAWITASRLLGGGARRALVVAAEAPSFYLDRAQPQIAAVYGDGAAALVLEHDPAHDGGLVQARFDRRDPVGRAFTVPGALPPRARAIEAGEYRFQPPDAAYTDRIDEAWRETLRALSAVRADVFVPYAVTRAQVEAARAALAISAERTVERLADVGCIGCAGPLFHVHAARSTRSLERGASIVSAAVAGGITSAALAWRM